MSIAIAENLARIRGRMASAAMRAGRSVSEVELLAISKFVSLDVLEQAYQLGICKFGESYVQEALPKISAFAGRSRAVEFELVGRLQQNKVRRAVGNFSLLHAIDRPELVHSIAKVARERGICQRVLLQVNISRELSKGGVLSEHIDELLELALLEDSLDVVGFMSYGSSLEIEGEHSNENNSRREFASMRELAIALRAKFARPFPVLSMGTSDDFELAIEEGATQIRVGSALFEASATP